MRDANAKLFDAPGPVVLIIMLRNEHLWHAAACGSMRGPGAAVMDNGRYMFEQRLMIHLSDGDAIGSIIQD